MELNIIDLNKYIKDGQIVYNNDEALYLKDVVSIEYSDNNFVHIRQGKGEDTHLIAFHFEWYSKIDIY